MALCKHCEQPAFWAQQRFGGANDDGGFVSVRWRLCELESLRDNDELCEGDRGSYVVFRPYHVLHRCGLRMQRASAPSGPHATLFVLPNAPIEVVRAAFRALAKLHHPDVGGSPERMIALNQAYSEITGED